MAEAYCSIDRQLSVEGFACQEIFERRRLGSEVLAYIRLFAEKGPGRPERLPRSIKVAQAAAPTELVRAPPRA